MITNLLHFGMVIVGLDYGHAGQMTLEEITGGSPYGATTIAGRDGSRQPTANDTPGRSLSGAQDCRSGEQAARLNHPSTLGARLLDAESGDAGDISGPHAAVLVRIA